MAAVTGTIVSVGAHRTPIGPVVDSVNKNILQCEIYCTFAGTYATSDDGTIAAVNTAIQNSRRDGRTVVVLGACGASAGLESTTPIGILAAGVSHSAGTLTVQLTDGALTAEHGAALLATFTRPIPITVTYNLSAI